MTNYKLLGELIHYCTKCKLNLNHMITLMNKNQPQTLLCLTCKTTRQYRAPKGTSLGSSLKKSSSGTRAPSRQKLDESTWRTWLNNESKTPKPYAMDGSFALEDIVNHPVFGRGVIVGFVDPGKVQIFFYDHVKLLMGQKLKDKK
ncbi:MAG: hypothetical protein ACD_73C00031G0002 [uncultured bacterium]|nr:MAG: hypothetical protein ACD_73C00031G0002 [uncultured bacterium]